MTEALNRVIAEQQKRIDELTEGNKKLIERAANVFKRNDDLFEEVAKLIDCRITPSLLLILSCHHLLKISDLRRL